MLSMDNRAVLEHVTKRSVDGVAKITMDLPNLNKLLDAVRQDERANIAGAHIDAAIATLKGE